MERKRKDVIREKQVPIPEEWGDKYSDEDKAGVIKIIEWLNGANGREAGQESQRTRSMLGRVSGIHATTMHLIVSGAYKCPPTKYIKKALAAINQEKDRNTLKSRVRLAFTETTVTKTVYSICHRVSLYNDMGVIAGNPGTGKTEGLQRYCEQNPQAILLYATWNMNPGILLDELVEATGAEVITSKRYSQGTHAQKMAAVVKKLKGQDRIIIIDEADLMVPATLETLRRINDLTEVGIVLAGEPKLKAMITKKHGRFERIASRVGFWAPVIKHITKEDCHALIEATLDEQTISPEIHDAFWQACEGSARMLSKLLPNVRDFGLSQGHELSPKLIFDVAQKTLSYERKARASA